MTSRVNAINLKELSYLTGFSISTVSKALNDKVDISDRTKRHITCVAEKHNYIPNSFGTGLRNKKSSTIAIILPQINIKFYSNILSNFQKIANDHAYKTMVFQSYDRYESEKEHLRSISDGSVDGVILITNKKTDVESENYMVPIVPISRKAAPKSNNLNDFCTLTFGKLLTKIS